ncbi:MAG: adenylyltransferase, partial [Planctomycetes bacterium]|nr:adenylyltransferase [Planctomycetota bacterium]
MASHIVEPHGGRLINLMVAQERADELKKASRDWPSWDLTQRQLCDLELLLNGGFSPLQGFLKRDDYESVCRKMRLADGTLWPLPIPLDIPRERAEELESGSKLVLRDPEGVALAVLHVAEIWEPDIDEEAVQVYGTGDPAHAGVAYLKERVNPCYVGG